MDVELLKVFDSRGSPTLSAFLKYNKEYLESFVPSGKSTGTHEVCSFPLKKGKQSIEESFAFFKKNKKAIETAMDFDNQEEFDSFLEELDDSSNFAEMGGSLALALSMLHLKLLAKKSGKEVFQYLNPKAKLKDLPKPLGNVIGGGLHSHNKIPVQEFLVLNTKHSVAENVKLNIKVHNTIENILLKKNIFFGENDEGAISENVSFANALNVLEDAIDKVGEKTKIGLDIAASEFYKNKIYKFENKKYAENEFSSFLQRLLKEHKNIVYLEDPFYEESFEAFANLQKKTSVLICGDDLYTTNLERLKKGIAKKSTKAILIKPNQIGTITKTQETVKYAQKHGVVPVISHRSGETSDTLIAHLAVGWKIPYIKTGTISGERLAKLNELIFIEKLLR